MIQNENNIVLYPTQFKPNSSYVIVNFHEVKTAENSERKAKEISENKYIEIHFLSKYKIYSRVVSDFEI